MGLGRALKALAGVVLAGCSSAVSMYAEPPRVRPVPPSAIHDVMPPRPEPPPAAELAFETTAPSVPAPTWASVYARYFGPGTAGSCGRSRACHADVMVDADSAYQWLAQRGYIAGAQSPLVGSNSCLRWFGGNMPPRGAPNEEAARDLGAWAAAGAQNN